VAGIFGKFWSQSAKARAYPKKYTRHHEFFTKRCPGAFLKENGTTVYSVHAFPPRKLKSWKTMHDQNYAIGAVCKIHVYISHNVCYQLNAKYCNSYTIFCGILCLGNIPRVVGENNTVGWHVLGTPLPPITVLVLKRDYFSWKRERKKWGGNEKKIHVLHVLYVRRYLLYTGGC
jgi:hypothetical protein